MFFINGMFWQQGQMPFLGSAPSIGTVVMIGEQQIDAVFSGVIGERSLAAGNDGFLTDMFGKSVLSDFQLNDKKLKFVKQYLRRLEDGPDFRIQYAFTKDGAGVWVGTWSAPAVGKGEARCVLTEIPAGFFEQPEPGKK